ncbi:MAG TPA: protein phosphatase 2C domain-containing protein [Planctomycetaceae bacterium]|jgi:hypothetical protein
MTAAFPMPVRCRSFQLPKGGNRAEELEDAVAGDSARGVFAVADGASDSICADVWAKLLAEEFVANPPGNLAAWAAWLAPLRRRWWDDVRARSLPWPAEHKLAAGAGATLVGLEIRPDATWTATAVGDSCLFQVRSGELIVKFPLSRSDEFDNHPPLVGTRTVPVDCEPRDLRGGWLAGDELWLMTDALAHWFLKECEIGQSPAPQLRDLLDLPTPDQQAARIMQWRQTQHLRNDDFTCTLIEI